MVARHICWSDNDKVNADKPAQISIGAPPMIPVTSIGVMLRVPSTWTDKLSSSDVPTFNKRNVNGVDGLSTH
jgi:hypothetical protein